MTDHTVQPSMKRVAVIPWGEELGCYVCISGKKRRQEVVGEKWYPHYAQHSELATAFPNREIATESYISFTYVESGIAAEWDGEHGPIQLWFKCEDGYKNEYDEASAHWLWPFAYGSGHWSQLAVDGAMLPRLFNEGNYAAIFSELRSWVKSRLSEQGVETEASQ